MEDTITLNASCHCRGFSASYTLPTSAFPLKSAICSCNSCRHVTGQLFASFAVIPSPDRPSGGTLAKYAFSANLTVVFCRVCGATIANLEPDEWEFATGVLSVVRGAEGDERREGKGKGIEGLLDRQCLFAADALDGGGLVWLPEVNSAGREMKRHIGHRTSGLVDLEAMKRDFLAKDEKNPDSNIDEEKLHGSCHCGGVKFYITRPTPSGEPPADSKKGKWWLADSKDPNCRHYEAQLDACDSCRLCSGFEVNAWVFVPICNVFAENNHGTSRPFDVHDEKLNIARYSSSAGNWRSFCKTCGAPVCFWSEKREIMIIDFGAGLFHGRGARCEDWVKWNGIEYGDDAMDRKMVADIEARAVLGAIEHISITNLEHDFGSTMLNNLVRHAQLNLPYAQVMNFPRVGSPFERVVDIEMKDLH